ncbi:NUDIX domain-containing protein [Tropicimonas sp. IMCC6043]|uniref:NUDIX domain-containing protein n=1 Tax=Tropicimonas sp. IMCC6043 TaxID=2510645 RepID=UPI00101B91BC|nr:NUDIX hydrolase [Tropicimonas sp. IMCC6043]RYH10847.1 NUDIX domain-containing protein [Tropicimonas sp. IMCC6043]
MIRRVGERVQATQRYQLRPGVYAILRRGDLVLLTHQAEPVPELQLPGGGIDPGEQPIAALHREVYEETGWTMRVTRRLGAFRRFTYMPDYDIWAEKLCAVYLGAPVLRKGSPPEPGHLALWLPAVEAADALGNAGDRHFMRRLLGK